MSALPSSEALRHRLSRPALHRFHNRKHKRTPFLSRFRSIPSTEEVLALQPKITKEMPCPPAYFQTLINNALNSAWLEATIKSYATGINSYFAFCRLHSLPMKLAFPISKYMLCAFIATKQYLSPQTLKNYVNGLRALHTRNNFSFPVSTRVTLLIRSARSSLPQPNPKLAITIDMLDLLAAHLLPNDAFDSAVLFCASLAFWGLCRLGELLPSSLSSSYDQTKFPLVRHAIMGNDNLSLTLPWTKTTKRKGATLSISPQHGPSSPTNCFSTFRATTQTPPDWPLFAINTQAGRSLLTKRAFLRRVNEIWASLGIPHHTGHSFRIGGATHLLLCGVHPDVVKKYGRWSSDSFLRYWRSLNTILPSHVRFASRSAAPSGGVRLGLGDPAAAAPLVLGQPASPSAPPGRRRIHQ